MRFMSWVCCTLGIFGALLFAGCSTEETPSIAADPAAAPEEPPIALSKQAAPEKDAPTAQKTPTNPPQAEQDPPSELSELLELDDLTEAVGQNEQPRHEYSFTVGVATGAKMRFVRLQYQGGDWDQDLNAGGDLNMLIEYNVRTSQAIANRSESCKIAELGESPVGQSPPLVYLTGQQSISLSDNEIKTLREYLIDKHGMLLGDNGGSKAFHEAFFAMMGKVLPKVKPVRVPSDDTLHLVPFRVRTVPIVEPHGGTDAWGWKVDGRWVCYYHPGDLGEAWAGPLGDARKEVWEPCYRLGTNLLFNASAEHAKWLKSQGK